MRSTGVRLVGLEKWFDDVLAVRSLQLEIESGEFVVLLGPSGCGKTTVLRMIAGLEEPTNGEIFIGERLANELEPGERDVAMVFQNYALYPHMSVRRNLGFGLKMQKMARADIDKRIRWAADVLDLSGLLNRKPAQLSGGQRQRVALGRALVREPRVFLFDEPLSNLDAGLRLAMRSEIAELHRKLQATMIFVTHDQVEAMTLGERIAVLKGGVLQQCARPLEVYRKPANLFVAKFIGTPSINTIDGKVWQDSERSIFRAPGLELSVPSMEFSGAATIGVRPEAIALLHAESGDRDFGTIIRRLEPLGNEMLVHIDGPDGVSWVARVDPEHECATGDRIGVRIDRSRIHLFAGDDMTRIEARVVGGEL